MYQEGVSICDEGVCVCVYDECLCVSWELQWRRNLFVWEEQMKSDLIKSLDTVTLYRDVIDTWCWEGNMSYTVKRAYELLHGITDSQSSDFFKQLWELKAPSKVKALVWRITLSRIPTRADLKRRGILGLSDVTICPLCNEGEENISHLFLCVQGCSFHLVSVCKMVWLYIRFPILIY